MSSSTATISSKNSPMNNNDRKRPISSSIRPSPSPPSAKRHNLSSKSKKILCQTDRLSRSKQQQYRHRDDRSSSSNSSRSSSNSEFLNLDSTKTSSSIALIVQPNSTTIDQRNLSTNYDSDEDFQSNTKQILTKSIVPSSMMTIVTTPDLTKNVLNINSNSSTKLVKLVVPQSTISSSSSSIKMLSSGDGLASALRVPTKIQLTKTLFVSSTKNEKNSSLISSTNQEQLTFSPSSTTLLDIPIDLTEKQQQQQSVGDYHSSTRLPPTPPPPIIDNTNSNNQQEKIKDISTNQINEENDSSNSDEIKTKRHSSSLSDWSVPPTSELSPRSLTSSSPDLTQNHSSTDDTLIELDLKQSTKRRYHSLSSCLQSKQNLFKPFKSKSLTRLTNISDKNLTLIENQRSLTSSPTIRLSSVQRIKKRRRDNEYLLLNRKSKSKHIKIEFDNHIIIQNLLNEIIERIVSTNNEKDNTLKNLLIKPVPHVQQILSIDIIPNRQTKRSISKKLFPSSQSLDSTEQNESRSMIMTRKELDELAYLLHANVQRSVYEQIDNPTKVEERMREMWSQMSNQKKNSYYKRVIQIYKRPNRDVVITSSSSTIETNSLLSNDSIDNTNSMNSLSIDLKRQTSTPLSFHSINSSSNDESPYESTTKTTIFTDIVNELIKGAKGLDKLSCTPTAFANSIHNFVRSTIDKQNQILLNLEQQVEKKCSSQLNRASIFWKQKINYFANKHQINSSNESMNELTLIVKYFYLYVLSLNCRKQEIEFESALTDLLNGNLIFIDPSFCSSILTSIIEDLILRSTLANDYLASQFLIINDIEYSLPFIRNSELENELLTKNETYLSTNPFIDFNDLEDYLNRCEHMTANIPCYPIQPSHHSSMYYPPYHPPPPQYYYPPPPPPSQSSDMNNYYYNPPTGYPYGQSTSFYHPSPSYNNNNNNNNNNEQYKYYYNQQGYSLQPNSTNDIPSVHRSYRQMNSNIQRTYSNSQQPTTPTPTTPGTPAVFDATTVVSPQSKSMNTINNNYPP